MCYLHRLVSRILFLAPQPFFQERGTPIAVRLAASVIAQTESRHVDLLTYAEGQEITIPGVTIHRIWAPSFLKGIRPGISIKKLLCDCIFLCKALSMVWKARKDQYNIVHAVEESVFIALIIKLIFGIPYIYDMDSSLVLQLTEKWSLLRPLLPIFEQLEKCAVRHSIAVVPVCDALAVIADTHGSKQTTTLYDISLLSMEQGRQWHDEDLKKTLNLPPETKLVLYIGNLERYQGIDLLIDGFAAIAESVPDAHLVIIGGAPEHVKQYQEKARSLGLSNRISLVGPRPVSTLNHYLTQATVLTSPRTVGNNTPMKIYSYIHAGVPLLATDLPTHTQVLTNEIAMLAAPDAQSFGKGLKDLLLSEPLRTRLAQNAFAVAEERYTFTVFKQKLNELYDLLDKR